MKKDTAEIKIFTLLNKEKLKGYDSLINYLYNPYSDSTVKYIYYLQRKYAGNFIALDFDRRTFNQLQNAGGMQLIRNRNASDNIRDYYETALRTDQQVKAFADLYQLEATRNSYKIFDGIYYKGINSEISGNLLTSPKKIKFLTTDTILIKSYANQIQASASVLNGYIYGLTVAEEQSIQLIKTLQKEYHLQNE